MLWIIAIILLVVIFWLAFGDGINDFRNRKYIYDLMHDYEPTYWEIINAVNESASMEELDRLCIMGNRMLDYFCGQLRINSTFGESVADGYYNRYKEAVDEAIKRLKAE